MNIRMRIVFLLLGALALTGSAWAETWLTSETRPGGLLVHLQSESEPVRLNQMHRWRVLVQDAEGVPVEGLGIEVDGGMPAHDHGLPTQPAVQPHPEPGMYWLEGMRFHMAGEWTLDLLLVHEGRRYRAAFQFDL